MMAWRLARKKISLPKILEDIEACGEMAGKIDWFIRLRWLALSGIVLTVIFSQHIAHLLPPEVSPPLWLGVSALFLSNLLFIRLKAAAKSIRANILFQAVSDLLILTFLLHFSGGLENPFFVIYAFHVILAGILLTRKDTFAITAAAAGLFLVLGFGEYFEIFEHHSLISFPHSVAVHGEAEVCHQFHYVLGVSAAFISLLAGTAYFITTIMEQLRRNYHQMLRTERLGALGQLVAYLAHEVNNPVGIISTRAKLAGGKKQLEKEFLQETFEIIGRQADRVSKVVRSLLTFSKPTSQPASLVDLNQVLSEAVLLTEEKMAKAGIKLERSASDPVPQVRARYNDLLHVFLNLINNAVDAMPAGGTIRIKTQCADGNAQALIADTGEGIPEENMQKIFEPFFTTKSLEEGNGLGLAISLSLVRSLGGEIFVKSAAKKGSCFAVQIPVSVN